MSETIQILTATIQGAYYFEDVSALQQNSIKEEDRWITEGKTEGFKTVRQLSSGVSLGLKIDNKNVYWGDCISVSYSGKSGREKLLSPKELEETINQNLLPNISKCIDISFRATMHKISNLSLPKSVEYGVSQALLSYFAEQNQCTMSDILVKEWDLKKINKPLNFHGSSGNNRYENADKMIINELECIPHTQVDQIKEQLGLHGEVLENYVKWIVDRINTLKPNDYHPTLHFDVHGAIGKIFQGSLEKIADYLLSLEKNCPNYKLRIESVALEENRSKQIGFYLNLRRLLKAKNSKVELVADEWANTYQDILEFLKSECVDMIHIKMPDMGGLDKSLEAVLACQKYNVQSLLGGSCIETELSTRASIHLGMAVQPTEFLVKPGMGIDEGIMLCRNEMQRILALPKRTTSYTK